MDGPRSTPLVIARGGAADVAPASTIAALEAALDVGADALWLGIQLSKDGHPVVLGSASLDGVSDGRGPVGALTVRELKRLDAGGWKTPRYGGQRIQTLSEVFERFRGRTRFWIALTNVEEVSPVLEEKVISTLEIYDAVNISVVAVGGLQSLARLRGWNAEVGLAALWTRGALEDALAEKGPARALCAAARLVTPEALARIRAAGLECHVQMDDEPVRGDRLVFPGVDARSVDGFITGRPEPWLARMGRR